MLFPQLPFLLLAATMFPSFVEAGMFYKNSPVKMLDAKSFKKAMRENVRCVVVWNALSLESSLAGVFWVVNIANEHRGVRCALVWGLSRLLACIRASADVTKHLAL